MRFSVILPTRDRPEWIDQAVQSVIGQSFPIWELIVLDNSDVPYFTSSPWQDNRVRYVHLECDGVADAYNRALELAYGDIVVPLADDDVLPVDTLRVSDELFGDAQWLNGRTLIIDTAGSVIAERGGNYSSLGTTLAGTYWLGGAVHWRKSLTDRLGGFSSDYDGAADFDLYLRFLKDSDPVVTETVMYVYRDWPGTDSRVRAENQRVMSQRIANQT